MSEIKLKNCPFCGGEAEIVGKHWVQCRRCATEGGYYDNIETAIEVWNTRKPMERIVERLEELENITLDQYNNSMARTYEHDFADGKECGVSMALDIVRNGGKE